jgi:coenzyme F420-dependent glucose-6-phosphate dehydrogenase
VLRLAYWCGQEQYDPYKLLEFATIAEVVGFDIIAVSDHFHPWSDKGGQSGFPWIIATLIAEKTKRVEVGTAVTTPLFRYHPAIVAQAFATLAYLYPGRIFLTLGTGHSMNETPLGFKWPEFKEKVERLEEAIEIIKLLWEKEFVTYIGNYYKLYKAKLYTKPKSKIPLYIATSNKYVARIAGKYADGILVNPRGLENYNEIIQSMERAAIKAGRDPKKLKKLMEFKVSYDVDYEKALNSTLFWASTAIPRDKREKISDPRELESMVTKEEIEKIKRTWLITSDTDEIIKTLEQFLKLNFDIIFIHSSSPDEKKFLSVLGRDILPWMREFYELISKPIRVAID